MQRVDGRTAITVMAKMDLGLCKLTADEEAYVFRQVVSFREWLVREKNVPLEDAKDICRKLYDKDTEILQNPQFDPYADFIWSRGQEVGQAEIDLALIADMDFEGGSNADFEVHQAYWRHMEMTAEKFGGKMSPEQWKASSAKFTEIAGVINSLAAQYRGKLLTTKDHMYMAKVNRRLNELRFGKQPMLVFRHWALCHNLLVNLVGSGKIIKISVPEDPDVDAANEDMDAMSLVVQTLDEEQSYDD